MKGLGYRLKKRTLLLTQPKPAIIAQYYAWYGVDPPEREGDAAGAGPASGTEGAAAAAGEAGEAKGVSGGKAEDSLALIACYGSDSEDD